MLSEEHLIPYHASDLTGKRILCLAPHPDDETLGCGGALAIHRNAGDPVKVVFLTNGAAGDSKATIDPDGYVRLRRREAEKACRILGVTDLDFWPYPDRGLAGSRGALPQMIRLLNDYAPQLVYVPSPMEFHPDHRASCFLLCDAISDHDGDFEVIFYELGQPICINRLVDITPVLKQKSDAINAYESQLREQPYDELCLSLDRYRSMTLPDGITHAEGFSLWEAALIKKAGVLSLPFQNPRRFGLDFPEAGPLVSVIIRTQDRPKLMANALRSVVEQTYANLEVVLVNDGGIDVADVARAVSGNMPVTLLRHEKKKGRSAAANSGLAAAKGKYLNFLDDDDVFYPHHVETLVRHLEMTGGNVAYSGVKNAYFNGPPHEEGTRQREEVVFNFNYDPDRLLFENYIPIMSVLFSKQALEQAGGLSNDLELFEDWDFWIRMSRAFSFQHVDQVTAEYRFYNTSSVANSHRRKYHYDEARAYVFDGALPYIDGRAWANYQKNALERAEAAAKFKEHAAAQTCNQNQTGAVPRISELLSLQEKIVETKEQTVLLKSGNEALMVQNELLEKKLNGYKERIKAIENTSFRRILRKLPAFPRIRNRRNGEDP